MQVHLDPTRSRRHVLPVVFSAPALDEGHPDGAHLGQLVHRLEAVVDGLGEQGGELLVVEDLQAAARRDLAHCGWVKAGEGCTLDDDQVLDAQGTCGGNCSFSIAQRLLSLRGTQRRLPRQRSRDEHPCRCVVECSQ